MEMDFNVTYLAKFIKSQGIKCIKRTKCWVTI